MIDPTKLLFSQKRAFHHSDNYEYDIVFDSETLKEEIKASSLNIITQLKINQSSSYKLKLEQDQCAVILPLYGEIDIDGNKINTGDAITVQKSAKIINHSKDQMIECIFFVLNSNAPETKQTDWYSNEDALKTVFNNETIDINIGLLGGREELELSLTDDKQFLFYNVNGAFKVNEYLIDSRDGIIYNQNTDVKIISLSRQAVYFWIEMK